jgi:hypothetical protein
MVFRSVYNPKSLGLLLLHDQGPDDQTAKDQMHVKHNVK